jgi:hypothetical protein
MPSEPRELRLRNGNPRVDPSELPRCLAMTRRGTACQRPARANGGVGSMAAFCTFLCANPGYSAQSTARAVPPPRGESMNSSLRSR